MVQFFTDDGDIIQDPDENGEYTCPVCKDYTGKRGSVEAHITGKSDQSHKGLVGKDFRAELPNGDVQLRRGDPPEDRPSQAELENAPHISERSSGTGDPVLEDGDDPGDGDESVDELEDEDGDEDDDQTIADLVQFGLAVAIFYVLIRVSGQDNVQQAITRYGNP